MKVAGSPEVRAESTAHEPPLRRVRDEVKDGLAVMAFSAAASSALAVVLVVITTFARQR
jgi:hypothetical protein